MSNPNYFIVLLFRDAFIGVFLYKKPFIIKFSFKSMVCFVGMMNATLRLNEKFNPRLIST